MRNTTKVDYGRSRVSCCVLIACDLTFFFFSSRRRHTRSDRDWSSDVCSSDLSMASGSGREVLDDLIRAADVLIENFLPASLEKLGLTAERLAALNPRLVRARSEERRVGKECRYRWSPYH